MTIQIGAKPYSCFDDLLCMLRDCHRCAHAGFLMVRRHRIGVRATA